MSLIGCLKPETIIETHLVVPNVPTDLRTPCISEERPRITVTDAALIVGDLVQDRDCANSKIIAIDEILTDAESRANEG